LAIHGRVTDNGRVAQLTAEGQLIDLQPDGSFTFSRYVPRDGGTVTIIAIDEWGNKSERVVSLTRSEVATTTTISLAPLDPTGLSVRSDPNKLALIIGVSDYQRAPDATFADNDAEYFADYAHRALGVPIGNIKVLTNEAANRTDIKLALKQWLRGLARTDQSEITLFFAGHGLASQDGEDLYLLPYDGAATLLEDTALLRADLFRTLSSFSPKSVTVYVDTCYSGIGRGGEILIASARGIAINPKGSPIPANFTVFSAASGSQISRGFEETEHGLFSYFLMKGLEGNADADGDRRITAGELHAYVRDEVQRQAARMGHEQTPELQGDSSRVLVSW